MKVTRRTTEEIAQERNEKIAALEQFKKGDRVFDKLTKKHGVFHSKNLGNAMPSCWVRFDDLYGDEWFIPSEKDPGSADPLNLKLCQCNKPIPPIHDFLTSSVCSQEWADSSEASNSPDLVTNSESPSLSNLPNTQEKSLPSITPIPQSMTTCEHSTQNPEALMSSVADFPAKIFLLPENKPELEENNQDCSSRLSDSFAWYDQSSSSWKTSQTCLLTEWEPYLGSFPRAGTMRNGQLFPAPRWVESTKESESSSSLIPTPTASDATTGQIIGKNDTFKVTKNGTLRKHSQTGKNGSLGLGRYVQMLPTPKAADGSHPGVQACKPGQTRHLSAAVIAVKGAKLNPIFTERLMGFQENETALITSLEAQTSPNGLTEPQTQKTSPTEKNDSSASAIVSSQIAPPSLGGDFGVEPELTMDETEAKSAVSEINNACSTIRELLCELDARRGYIALGFANMTQLLKSDLFTKARSTLQKELQAGRIEKKNLKVPIGTFSESQLRSLSKLKDDYRPEAIVKAKEIAGDRPLTAKDISQSVASMVLERPETKARSIVDVVKEKTFVPLFERGDFAVGDVVIVKASGNSTLRSCDGYWGIIERISHFAHHICISVKEEKISDGSGQVTLLCCKGDEVEKLELNDGDKLLFRSISDRIKKLVWRNDLDSSAWWILEGLSRQTFFTQQQMELLEFLEAQYEIEQ